LTDHLAAAVRAHNEALAAQEQLKVAAARRDDAVRSAVNAGHSVTEIAQALGDVHRSRVYQMLGKKP
jgi:hypothetical protein